MSSFIHTPEMFNSVENKLLTDQKNTNNDYLYRITKSDIVEMMKEIRSISVLCVTLQYKHHYEGTLDTEIKEQLDIVHKVKKSLVIHTKVDLFKAITSIKYQIELYHLKDIRELTDSEKKAIDLFEKIYNDLAIEIVKNLDSYNNSKWWSV